MNHSTNGLIAVTGATGEVGGRVACRLASRGLAQRLIVPSLITGMPPFAVERTRHGMNSNR